MAIDHRGKLTETEKANLQFLERARQITGVVSVEPYGGQTIGEQSFRVYVRDGDVGAEYRVYHLKGELYEAYPTARLDVLVFEESDLAEAEVAGRSVTG